jgi:hypothetical protein
MCIWSGSGRSRKATTRQAPRAQCNIYKKKLLSCKTKYRTCFCTVGRSSGQCATQLHIVAAPNLSTFVFVVRAEHGGWRLPCRARVPSGLWSGVANAAWFGPPMYSTMHLPRILIGGGPIGYARWDKAYPGVQQSYIHDINFLCKKKRKEAISFGLPFTCACIADETREEVTASARGRTEGEVESSVVIYSSLSVRQSQIVFVCTFEACSHGGARALTAQTYGAGRPDGD